jgi:serine/threonine-protein kinase
MPAGLAAQDDTACGSAAGGDKYQGVRPGCAHRCTPLKTRGILESMPAAESEAQAVRRQLQRVLDSTVFARTERLSRFLRFVVERHLDGRDDEIKESVIAIEIFGRRPDYNPKYDPIVRTEARRLRAHLSKYYATDGKSDVLVIDLPKGGYAPKFQPAETSHEPDRTIRRRLGIGVALVGFAAAAAAIGWWWTHHWGGPVAIAVLPLNNVSRDPANDYFADGLTSEIIRNLSIIDGLAVRSQTSSFAFKGKPRNLREAGRQLEADYILEGSVVRAGQQLRINAQFIRVRDEFALWSARYDRELTDALAIQDEISRGIVNSLRLKLGRGRRRYETSAEAYDLYLRARALGVQGGEPGYAQSIRPFEEAIAKDPSFAPAYAGLAASYAVRSGQLQFDSADEVAKMRTAAEKAIQLDPLLAEAHDALGMGYARDGKWKESEKSFRRAIGLDPSDSQAYLHIANYLLWPLGRIDEALKQLHLGEKADPLAPPIQNVMAYVLMSAGRNDEAAGYCEKLPADSAFKSNCLGQARLFQGRFGEAIQILEAALNRGGRGSGILGCAYARAGRRDEAEKLAADSSLNLFEQAQIFSCLGYDDRTFEALERATTAGPVRMGRLSRFQGYARLRGDPRMKALRKRVGLPE